MDLFHRAEFTAEFVIIIVLTMIFLITFCQEIKLQVSIDKKCNDKDYADFYLVKDSNMVINYTIVTKAGFYNVIFNPKTVSLSVGISNPPLLKY